MPDPRRLYRRITESNLPTRVIAHLSVVSLVVAASASGFAETQDIGTDAPDSDSFLSLVSSVRGAAEATDELSPISTTPSGLDALSEEQSTLLDRAAPAQAPDDDATPLPTPVPVDPDATPLAAPTDANVAVGSTDSARGALSNRAAPPAPQAPTGLAWPVPAGSITQYFHAGHLALDIGASYGSQVVAAQSGTVNWAGWRNNGGGYVISITHGGGMKTVYNHLGSIWVSPGQWVAAGQGIGAVGCTGICTGPHVHFEVIVNGRLDNPLRYF